MRSRHGRALSLYCDQQAVVRRRHLICAVDQDNLLCQLRLVAVHLRLIEREVEGHQARRHHERVRGDGIGERLAVRDRLQRGARE